MSMETADYYYPLTEALLILFAIQGQKIDGMAEDSNPQP